MKHVGHADNSLRSGVFTHTMRLTDTDRQWTDRRTDRQTERAVSYNDRTNYRHQVNPGVISYSLVTRWWSRKYCDDM